MAPSTSCEVEQTPVEYSLANLSGKSPYPPFLPHPPLPLPFQSLLQPVGMVLNNSTTKCIFEIWNHWYETIPTTGCEVWPTGVRIWPREMGKPRERDRPARKQAAQGLPALQAVEAADNRNDIFIARFMSWAITYQSLSWSSRMHLVFQTCSFCASGSWAAAA